MYMLVIIGLDICCLSLLRRFTFVSNLFRITKPQQHTHHMKCLEKLANDFENTRKEVEFANASFKMLFELKTQYLEMLSKVGKGSENMPWKTAKALAESLNIEMRSVEVFIAFLQGSVMPSFSSLKDELSQDFSSFQSKVRSFEARDKELALQIERAENDHGQDPIVQHYTIQGYLNKRSLHSHKNREMLEGSLENGISDINRARDALRLGIQRFNVYKRKFLENECELNRYGEIFADFEEKLNLQSFKNMLDDELHVKPGVGAEGPNSISYKEEVKIKSGFSDWKDCLLVLLNEKILLIEIAEKERVSLPDLLADNKPLEYNISSVEVTRVGDKKVSLVRKHQGFLSSLLGFNSFGLKFSSKVSLQNFIEALSNKPAGPKIKDENNPWSE